MSQTSDALAGNTRSPHHCSAASCESNLSLAFVRPLPRADQHQSRRGKSRDSAIGHLRDGQGRVVLFHFERPESVRVIAENVSKRRRVRIRGVGLRGRSENRNVEAFGLHRRKLQAARNECPNRRRRDRNGIRMTPGRGAPLPMPGIKFGGSALPVPTTAKLSGTIILNVPV